MSPRARAVIAFLVVVVIPTAAHAAPEGEGEDSALTVVALVGAVGIAYLLARFVVGRLQKAFLVMAGVEYLLLGVLLGEQMPYRMPAFSNLEHLLPIVALAVGWVGLLRGMEVTVEKMRGGKTIGVTRIVTVQAFVAGGLTTGAAYLAFASGSLAAIDDRQAWMAAGVMGCAAAAGSTGPITILHKRYRLEGELPARIQSMAAMSDLVAIVVFGLLFCIHHQNEPEANVLPSWFEWWGISVFLGVLLGVFFRPFLGENDSENGRFLALIGIITLASGAAYFLDLSPLFVNLALGIVLVNSAKAGPQIRETLRSTRQPMTLVLLVFAGALWRPPDAPITAIVLVCVFYIALRIVGKWAGTGLAAWRSPLRSDYYRGLLAHGDVSVAMAVSLRLVYEGPAVDIAYTAILVSVVASDLIAPRVLRGLLVDTGDLRGEREETA